jgi:hypothetical protein
MYIDEHVLKASILNVSYEMAKMQMCFYLNIIWEIPM